MQYYFTNYSDRPFTMQCILTFYNSLTSHDSELFFKCIFYIEHVNSFQTDWYHYDIYDSLLSLGHYISTGVFIPEGISHPVVSSSSLRWLIVEI